ncbi:MAG TPA: hypothetical protein VEM40_11675 [Nitrospirota bacterium]|nr:hypothetical protein [Nitrospirota bacterium]
MIEKENLLCYNQFTMEELKLAGLVPSVAKRISPMVEEIVRERPQDIHSFHVVGSAVMPDYNEKLSDINSVVILHTMDLRFISFLAPLGKRHGKKRIAAPLVMTPEYIQDSRDAFPIEFLDFKLIHKTVYGGDIFRDIEIARQPLRLQAEREIKTKLMGLRQGYISSLGKKEPLATLLVRSITGSMALFRAIISLLGKEPPVARAEVIKTYESATDIQADIFTELLLLKSGEMKPSDHELRALFDRYYNALEGTGKIIDELRV